MKFDPIVKRDIAVASRSYRLTALVMILNAALFSVVLVLLFGRLTGMRLERSLDQRTTLYIYALGIFAVFFLVLLAFPAFTLGSITTERDSGTLDLMLASSLTPLRIVSGKLISQLLPALTLLASFFPAMILPLVFGGVDLQLCLGLLLLLVPITVLLLCIGLSASAVSHTTTGSVLLGYAAVFGMTGLPFLLAFLLQLLIPDRGAGTFFLYFSPLTQLSATVLKQIGETELLEQLAGALGVQEVPAFLAHLNLKCMILQSFCAALFFLLAVARTVPGWNLKMHRKYGKRRYAPVQTQKEEPIAFDGSGTDQ